MQPTIDKITTGVAAAGVASPVWLPSLSDVSQTASLLLPVLGCGWLLVQIALKIWRKGKD